MLQDVALLLGPLQRLLQLTDLFVLSRALPVAGEGGLGIGGELLAPAVERVHIDVEVATNHFPEASDPAVSIVRPQTGSTAAMREPLDHPSRSRGAYPRRSMVVVVPASVVLIFIFRKRCQQPVDQARLFSFGESSLRMRG